MPKIQKYKKYNLSQTIIISEDMRNDLIDLAEKEERSLSKVICIILKKYLDGKMKDLKKG